MTAPKPATLKVQLDKLTLGQLAALRGYERQHQLLEAIEAAGQAVPQPVLSGMYRGDEAYPKARAAVASVLDVNEDELLAIIRNGRTAA